MRRERQLPMALLTVVVLATVAVIGSALASVLPVPLAVILWLTVLVLVLALERWRYKPVDAATPGPGWEATPERFIDPESGPVRVWYQPATGERRYVRDTGLGRVREQT